MALTCVQMVQIVHETKTDHRSIYVYLLSIARKKKYIYYFENKYIATVIFVWSTVNSLSWLPENLKARVFG